MGDLYRGDAMRQSLTFLLGLLLLCTGWGCRSSSDQKNKAIVRINIVDDPYSLDPRKSMDLKGSSLLKMLFEGLTRTNAQDVPELALAEDVEISSDLKTYTFKLRESVWSNGDPVTAFDFAYAWKKALSPSFPSDSAFHLYVIKNAKLAKRAK